MAQQVVLEEAVELEEEAEAHSGDDGFPANKRREASEWLGQQVSHTALGDAVR